MDNQLVEIWEKEVRIGTFLVAKGFERKHEYVLRLIQNHKADFEYLAVLKTGKRKQKRGRPVEELWLTEKQFVFLGMLVKNTKKAVRFKRDVSEAFIDAKNLLFSVKARQSNQKWIMSRDFGKEQRLEATTAIQEFVEYAKEQGSENADRYYTIISRMVNGLLFISAGKFKNLRDVLSAQQLMVVANAEQIITKGLRDAMKSKMFYKDIYKKIKSDVLAFAGLTGQTKVIEDQLKIGEKIEKRVTD